MLLAPNIDRSPVANYVERNTTISQISSWVEQTTNTYASYRTKTANIINTDSFKIDIRCVEVYAYDNRIPEEENVETDIYTVIYYECKNTDLNSAVVQIDSTFQNQYDIKTIENEYWIVEDLKELAGMNDFLNGQSYTTPEQYQTLVYQINNATDEGTLQERMTYNNVTDLMSLNYWVNNGTTSTNSAVIIHTYIQYAYTQELPNNTPYEGFYNYPKNFTFKIHFTGDSSGAGQIVDIPGLMFTILGMPFAWFSQAFNLTIFPGTVYEINLSHIFIVIIASLLLIVLLKKILK